MKIKNFLSRQLLFPRALGLVLVVVAAWLYGTSHPLLQALTQRLEAVAYDLRLLATLPQHGEIDPRVVIVDVDEFSLSRQGQWPWSRDKLAEMLYQMYQAEPAVIGFDMTFPEPENNRLRELIGQEDVFLQEFGEQEKQLLRDVSRALDGDQAFAEALRAGPVVLGFSFTPLNGEGDQQLPTPLLETDSPILEQLAVGQNTRPVSNIPLLQDSAAGTGFFSVTPDPDGVMRRAPLLARHRNYVYPSLALEITRQYFGAPPLQLVAAEVGRQPVLEGVSLDPVLSIPVDPQSNAIIRFRGPAGSFHYLSADSVLRGDFDHSLLRDAIVLIGTSAAGLSDLRSTPVDEVYPGVEIQANLILGMLDENLPLATAWSEGVDIFMLLGLGLLFALWFPGLRPTSMMLIALAAISGYLTAGTWLWKTHGIIFSQALPVLLLVLLAVLNALYGFVVEARSRNRLKSMFGQYVPPALVEEMNQQLNKNFGFQGESREMTVLFCDIRSFTTISESLSANELKQMLNYFFTPMTAEIFQNRGTIDKYVGDMIMAFWGAPLPDEQHRQHAITTALNMLQKVDEMGDALQQHGWPRIQIGVGLNTGVMNVGDMGSEYRRNYTVIGDAVNLGSRLEGLTKQYGVRLIVSEFTRQADDGFAYRHLDRVRVKGRNEPVNIYEPVGRVAELTKEQLQQLAAFDAVLKDYHTQRWDSARTRLQGLLEIDPQRMLYRLYLERIDDLSQQSLGDDWDGVFTHVTK